MVANTQNNVVTRQIRAGWSARNPELRLTAHGATEREAKINLIQVETTYWDCLSRSKVVEQDRYAALRERLDALSVGGAT